MSLVKVTFKSIYMHINSHLNGIYIYIKVEVQTFKLTIENSLFDLIIATILLILKILNELDSLEKLISRLLNVSFETDIILQVV